MKRIEYVEDDSPHAEERAKIVTDTEERFRKDLELAQSGDIRAAAELLLRYGLFLSEDSQLVMPKVMREYLLKALYQIYTTGDANEAFNLTRRKRGPHGDGSAWFQRLIADTVEYYVINGNEKSVTDASITVSNMIGAGDSTVSDWHNKYKKEILHVRWLVCDKLKWGQSYPSYENTLDHWMKKPEYERDYDLARWNVRKRYRDGIRRFIKESSN